MARDRMKKRPAAQPERRHSIQSTNSELRVDESQQNESDDEGEQAMEEEKVIFEMNEPIAVIKEPTVAPVSSEISQRPGEGNDEGFVLPASLEASSAGVNSQARLSNSMTGSASPPIVDGLQEAKDAPLALTEMVQSDVMIERDSEFIPSQVFRALSTLLT